MRTRDNAATSEGARALNDKSLVLTGAGGFLGRNLLPLLLGEGMRVVAVTSRTRGKLCALAGVDAACDALTVVGQGDRSGISDVLDGADFLVNAGFPRSDNGRQLAQGMDIIDWLFREAAARGTGAVVNISSQSVYDQYRAEPATEETPVCPQSLYAVAKYATELMLDSSCRGIPHTNIRLASLIGPGFDQRVVNKMVLAVKQGDEICIQDRTASFGYLDYADAATGIIALIKSDRMSWANTYNLGAKENCSVVEFGSIIKSLCESRGIEARVRVTGEKDSSLNSALSTARFETLTGWKPRRSVKDSIEIIVDAILIDKGDMSDASNKLVK